MNPLDPLPFEHPTYHHTLLATCVLPYSFYHRHNWNIYSEIKLGNFALDGWKNLALVWHDVEILKGYLIDLIVNFVVRLC